MQSSIPPLHFERHGVGTPLLAIHGWPVDHRIMSGFLEPFFASRRGVRRLYPDLPGMGRSAAGGANGTDDLLAAIEAFIDEHIGAEQFLLVGESFGGYLARVIAHRRVRQVQGLALICPVAAALEPDDRRVPSLRVRRPDPELIAGLGEREAAAFVELAVVQSAETLHRFREEVQPGPAAGNPVALERIRAAWQASGPSELDPPFTAPSLIVAGRQDSSVGYIDQFDLIESFPSATYAALDLAGHNLQFERPALLEALLDDWLDRVATEPMTRPPSGSIT